MGWVSKKQREIEKKLQDMNIEVEPTEAIQRQSEDCMILCARAVNPTPVQGTTKTEACSFCKEKVNLSPASQEVLRGRTANGLTTKLVCMECMMSVAALAPEDSK